MPLHENQLQRNHLEWPQLELADWDAATHMTKLEWRKACERSVKDYPDAFRR